MEFIKKHIYKISIILLILLMFKSCQSCSRGRMCDDLNIRIDSVRTCSFNNSTILLDSISVLNDIINDMKIQAKNDSIRISMQNERILELNTDKKSLARDRDALGNALIKVNDSKNNQ